MTPSKQNLQPTITRFNARTKDTTALLDFSFYFFVQRAGIQDAVSNRIVAERLDERDHVLLDPVILIPFTNPYRIRRYRAERLLQKRRSSGRPSDRRRCL